MGFMIVISWESCLYVLGLPTIGLAAEVQEGLSLQLNCQMSESTMARTFVVQLEKFSHTYWCWMTNCNNVHQEVG